MEITCNGTTVLDVARLRVLSVGGACLGLRGLYPIGMAMGLSVTLPGSDDAIACRAVVRSAVFGKGVGVEFLELTPDDRAHLHESWPARSPAP